jgi:hypothetical protein
MAARKQKQANPLVAFLAIRLFVSAIAGYFTRPDSAELRLGPVKVGVTGNRIAHGGRPLTSSQVRYIAMVTLIGGVIGLALGFGIKSGKIKV